MDNANLTDETDKLQRGYSELKSLSHNLTQKLENEKDFLNETNNNLTKERDELQKQIGERKYE